MRFETLKDARNALGNGKTVRAKVGNGPDIIRIYQIKTHRNDPAVYVRSLATGIWHIASKLFIGD